MKLRFLFLIPFLLMFTHVEATDLTVMINPAGDAAHVGRKLSEGYERGETLKCAQALQEKLGKKYNIQTLLARSPGEQAPHLQVASFANRLGIDFFLSLHLYREKSPKPKIYLYQLVYNQLVDFAPRTFNPLDFIPLHQAHFKNIRMTKQYAQSMHSTLTQEKYQKQFDCLAPAGIPLKPLVGISAPALVLEIGIQHDEQWQTLIEPLVESFWFLVTQT